ncbi:MAG: hypothetical protein INR70_30075 [Parafilimonas terrae]|nr:hypothetical protein [Parafilimonas terrae]
MGYKNPGTYAAVAVEVALDRESGTVHLVRVQAAIDGKQMANPHGIRDQISALEQTINTLGRRQWARSRMVASWPRIKSFAVLTHYLCAELPLLPWIRSRPA